MEPTSDQPQPLLPLSMPPVGPPPAEAAEVTPTTDEATDAERAQPIAAEPVTEPLMPLSMPPFAPASSTSPEGVPVVSGASGPLPPPSTGWYSGAMPPPPPTPSVARSGHGRIFLAFALVALLAGGLGAGLGAAFSPSSNNTSPPAALAPSSTLPASTIPVPKARAGSIQAIAAAAEPSVVDIQTDVAAAGQAAGTGIILTAGGEVLTNNHVVEDATSISVTITGHGTHPASVIGVDPTKDVALLQISGLTKALPFASLGDSSKAQVGDSIVAIGNELGYGGQPSVATGIISAKNRTITASEAQSASSETLNGLIQISAQILPGDSGGPLLNSSGQVIGMDTAASSDGGTSIGFAIPINEARQLVVAMQKGRTTGGIILGESAFLGVQFSPTTSPFFGVGNSAPAPTTTGAAIGGVVANGPAASAGLQGGDVITAVAGDKVTSEKSLETAIAKHRPGDQVSVSYLDASGAAHTATVKLAGIPE